MKLQIEETTHALMTLEKRNPLVGNRLRFIRTLRANPIIDWESQASNNGVNVKDAAQWLQLYMIGGVELLMNAGIKEPSLTGMPLSYSTLSRYVSRERLNQLNISFTLGVGGVNSLLPQKKKEYNKKRVE